LLLAFIVWWAVAQWHAAPVSILPVVALCARALPLIGVLQDDWQAWAHAQPAFRETQKIIRDAGAAREPDLPVSSTPLQPPIEVRSVTVSWDERASPALSNVDLSIAEVGIVALSGPSGAGKSTLADVVGGLLRPDSGVITVGGVTLSADLRRGWRRRVAYVQQEAVLFAGTIGENLRWAAPDASDEQLWEALESASAGFVRKMKHGLDTPVGEDGRHLSGGERQRLALARSLLRDPALLILDEPTSALDEESEEAIKEVLKRLKKKVAILLISHRKRLLDVADVVVNLEAGRVTKVRLPRSSR
jgi:ATP-binding cassette subfamily C protein